MASLIKTAVRTYRHLVYDLADPRTSEWFLMGSPLYPLGILLSYVYFVKVAGPRYMKDRPAYSLNRIVALYNIIQILLNVAIFIKAVKIVMMQNIVCEAVDYSDSPRALYITTACWEYFAIKVLDLLDTVFFVLRKKGKQITFLHLYHHMGMALSSWIGTRYFPGGNAVIVGLLNTFVHMFMYSYYLYSNTWRQHNIWWKKYITQLQMAQFVVISLHTLSALLVTDCQYPAIISSIVFVQNVSIFVMFFDFYRKAYGKGGD
ncbi:elongation of very long chain fatty acids protein AAEL008004-like isoform X2 [Zootermopsis nevadensis]|uniref:elongation of very long chain fatty acids protein AAEL008004-like isoform X2 n=1 Tax=Zootermopsis nevadensis TaxID=136037 RepID=UPI000B8ED08D|nr:elongation of very long chain fatty acids protein AAEL008004-like isoform X2 [Zootermopsis nevadensis]